EFGRTSPATFLGKITNYKRMVICIGSCKSGGFNIIKNNSLEKRTIFTGTGSSQAAAWYNWNYEYTNFYYYLISALNGTSPHGNTSVNTRNGWVSVMPEDNTDKETVISLTEAFNWSCDYILVSGRNCTSGEWETQVIGYNDMHNNTGLYPLCANAYPFTLPYNESSPQTSEQWKYVGMGGRGLGLSISLTPYPINLIRGDT
ncbi:MAG: hypothetical protein ACP5LE_08225, partial [Thermoplasmata archaeon]